MQHETVPVEYQQSALQPAGFDRGEWLLSALILEGLRSRCAERACAANRNDEIRTLNVEAETPVSVICNC
ncbi:hypothetical protein [Leisingera caerulea]|uniref:hypothetical protein n=1 Tax=Leisingera caerulea TaxID=506591 RepID=UPI0021A73B20|nr:hypothetical protein [Leisingera caerulea]